MSIPPDRWGSAGVHASVERLVSEQQGRSWTVREVRDLSDLACHPAAILSDGSLAVFAKLSASENGREQFEVELAGLSIMADRAEARTPAPVGIVDVPGGTVLVLEAAREIGRGPREWRDIGRTIARIHAIRGERFGLDTDGFFGPLPQDNRPGDDWPTFFAARRLGPGLRMATDSGHLPRAVGRRVESVIARLPDLCGPEVEPALLHGDARANNFISTRTGPIVIDPAVHLGHPEMDLASLGLWRDVPDDVLDGYREERAIDPGFAQRRELWRFWTYLAAVAVEGAGHLGRLTEALRPYAVSR